MNISTFLTLPKEVKEEILVAYNAAKNGSVEPKKAFEEADYAIFLRVKTQEIDRLQGVRALNEIGAFFWKLYEKEFLKEKAFFTALPWWND